MRELEVASLAANLRAEQNARALVLREESRVAVALHERQAFMKQPERHVDLRLQQAGDFFRQLARAADEQYLGVAEFPQQRHQPLDLRRQRVAAFSKIERGEMRLAFWEAG